MLIVGSLAASTHTYQETRPGVAAFKLDQEDRVVLRRRPRPRERGLDRC